ncbi:cupin-like domain-containing protein [Sorangium sp. So ce185]|uniref:cupin-like domain-containing protein n=1 Tax=Sorangium sp. So ce185 TaxID=3133287 RepID=UPI003F62DCFD
MSDRARLPGAGPGASPLTRVTTRLPFALPSFLRLSWASPQAEHVWSPALERARQETDERAAAGVLRGTVPAAIVRLPPFKVPRLLAQLGAGLRATVLGPDAPTGIARALIPALPDDRLHVALGPGADVDKISGAWARDDVGGLLPLLGWPACCLRTLLVTDFKDPIWSPVLGAPPASTFAPELNLLLRRLGVAAIPHVPCSFDCETSRTLGARLISEGPLLDVLGWPMQWSALHGIAEVLTPVFKLVHDTDATGEKREVKRLAERMPSEAARGVVFPYTAPPTRLIRLSRSFQRGLEHAGALERVDAARAVRQVELAALDCLPSEPVYLRGMSEAWPALHRWTPEFLRGRFGPVDVRLTRGYNGPYRTARFGDFLSSVMSGGALSAWYLIDFAFERLHPEMLDDYSVPPALRSWHHLLAPEERPGLRSLYLGGAGTGTALHVDILLTSAWNALLWGEKRWAFCPPDSDARLLDGQPDLFDPTVRRRLTRAGVIVHDCVQLPGDVLYTPTGWWHQVRNERPSLALTENFVNASNADEVARCIAGADHPVLAEIGSALRRAIELGVLQTASR